MFTRKCRFLPPKCAAQSPTNYVGFFSAPGILLLRQTGSPAPNLHHCLSQVRAKYLMALFHCVVWLGSFCVSTAVYIYAFSRHFIQSDLQCIQVIHLLSVCVPWESNPQHLRCQRNALPLSHRNRIYNSVLLFALDQLHNIKASALPLTGVVCLYVFSWGIREWRPPGARQV